MEPIMIKSIKERNAAFERMSPAEQRVAIAKDVIKQLDMKLLDAHQGTYESKPKDGVACQVCALGAMFVCVVGEDEALYGTSRRFQVLRNYFTTDQAYWIEAAFEGWEDSTAKEKQGEILAFYAKYPKDEDRMRAIMQNIIDNDGTFVLLAGERHMEAEKKTKSSKPKTPKPWSERTQLARLRAVIAWEKKIRKDNDAFANASDAQKRVMLAKDVLAALAAKRLEAQHDVYVPVRAGYEYWDTVAIKMDKPGHFVAYGDTCTVCAKGALFVAKVDRLNGYSTLDLYLRSNSDPENELQALFSRVQLALIENAFEGRDLNEYVLELQVWDDGHRMHLPSAEAQRALDMFGRRTWQENPGHVSPHDRMVAIMENIVANGGEFRP